MRSLGIKRIVVGLSGGVDSAVSALLLKNKGYELVGVCMKNWDTLDEYGKCTYEEDAEYAHKVCDRLSIKFIEANFVKEYWNSVFVNFLNQYEEGLTPNPDVLCNQFIKFDSFLKFSSKQLGADAIATGHYAKNSFGENLELANRKTGAYLLKAYDKLKDQTYFLSHIPQRALQKTLFPLGDYSKTSVKKIAEAAGLGFLTKKKESYGICFIGKRDFQKFISEYISPKPGNFVDIETGEVVGSHDGIHLYTLGQRCKLGGLPTAYYIVEKKKDAPNILVAPGHSHPALYSISFTITLPIWINSPPEALRNGEHFECLVKYCSSGFMHNCSISVNEQKGHVLLNSPQRAISPGQVAVFYLGEICLGGAVILERGPSLYELKNCKQH